MQALIRLKEDIRDERQKLIADGKWYPSLIRQWVEIQAAQGDRAAVSQLRGWHYRDRRKDKSRTTTTDRCVVLCDRLRWYTVIPVIGAVCRRTGVFVSVTVGRESLSVRIMVTGLFSVITMTAMRWQINWI